MINLTELTICKSYKDLGVTFDSKLKFKEHIANLTLQLRSTYGIFKRNFAKSDNHLAIKKIYNAYVQSKIDYGITVWGGAANSVIKPLMAIHKKFLKLTLGILLSAPQ